MASRGGLVAAILVFVASLVIAGVGGCNIHALGHRVTGRALGVRPRLAALLWRAAGVAVLGTAVSQVIVGVIEGSSPQGYARAQENPWVSLSCWSCR